jgi:hypothetical protein
MNTTLLTLRERGVSGKSSRHVITGRLCLLGISRGHPALLLPAAGEVFNTLLLLHSGTVHILPKDAEG